MTVSSALNSKPAGTTIDTRLLESLVSYNARRDFLTIIDVFAQRLAVCDLLVIDFSLLCLIHRNPGTTARRFGATLKIQPPNLLSKTSGFEKRGLIERQPHPQDGCAFGLHVTPSDNAVMAQAEHTATELEDAPTHRLSNAEKKTLIRFSQKIYL